MSDTSKRQDVAQAYDSVAWKNKVKRMTEQQIFAIWNRLKEQKRI